MLSSSDDKKPSGSGRIRTLSDLNRPSSGRISDNDDASPQEYFTGGEKSGILVQDPSKSNVDAIFDQARQQDPPENLHPSSSSRSFAGTGRSLSGEFVPSAPQQPVAIVHDIFFWRNGFTINGGPLRRLDDPENAPFLESLGKSECPKELEATDMRSLVTARLTRMEENYPEPEKRHVPFQGVGRILGSSSTTLEVPEPTVTAPLNTTPTPPMGLVVDESLPSTSIQLRLADGTRLVACFNYSHTVGDICSFINASWPCGTRTYQLQTVGFPPKVLTDATQTIEQAGLANSVVIQKF
ncbi:hypothetical protein ACH5RR_017562 [Cinchona calisaya]|uniref:Uncharacterized protein n=1 Tax=Cinchona calisaya TaxID=153742 RepID=A0ABD2ZK88_9GENT